MSRGVRPDHNRELRLTYARALARLRELHRDEFDRLLAEERGTK